MSGPLQIEVSDLAMGQIRAAEQWWRVGRPHAPNAIREELERASLLIALHPQVGARASNVSVAGVRRLHLARVIAEFRFADDLGEWVASAYRHLRLQLL